MKKLLSILLSTATLFTMIPSYATDRDSNPIIVVDGTMLSVSDEENPFIENDRVLVPMRAIFEALGTEVVWDNETQSITAENDQKEIHLQIGSAKMFINAKETNPTVSDTLLKTATLDAPARIVNDRTFVPLRAVSEAFGYDVQWNEEERSVRIKNTGSGTADEQPTITDDTYTSRLMSELPQDKNIVVSPLSLKIAMMMVSNGAEGETQKEMLDAFDVNDLEKYNSSVKELIARLNDIDDGEVNIANSIWFNKDYYNIKDSDFSDSFKNTISDIYNGNAETVTNKNSVEAVNEWVEDKTKGKIKDLLTEDNRNYLATLVNTVYMKADWRSPFKKEATYKDVFTDIDGKETETDFMHQTDYFQYYEDENIKMIRMPYTNGMSMYIVLGDTKNAELHMGSFTASDDSDVAVKKVALSIPKFKIEYDKELSDILKNMGIEKAFANNNPDFDKMVENVPEPIKIENVLQKAVIEVDEKGTEAAAATVVLMVGGSVAPPEEIIEFKVDKPFIYYIKDDKSGEILFAGRYVKAE